MAKDSTFQLYYHVIGTNQEDDKLIFDASKKNQTFHFLLQKINFL